MLETFEHMGNQSQHSDVTTYYLEMTTPSQQTAPTPRDGMSILHARTPSVPYYRFLYNTVGRDYHWFRRGQLCDSDLATLLRDPDDELHVLHVDGSPAGFAELDHRIPKEVELVQFGLMPEFLGQGLGKWFLQWTIDKVWSRQPKRFWLHTCSQDHPAALPLYKAAGFVQYRTCDGS